MRDSEMFINRELSWMEFDRRILGEAMDPKNRLFERLKFLSITASNLDEFFMVRVASLKDMVSAEYKKLDIAGMTAKEQLRALDIKTHEFVAEQYRTYNEILLPALSSIRFKIISDYRKLTEGQAELVDKYFHENVYPVLTPLAVDQSRPFPLIHNKALNIAALLKKKDSEEAEFDFATVEVPSVLPRFVRIPDEDGSVTYVLLEEIIKRNIHKLFLNYKIECFGGYRIMRSADLSIDEEDAEDLLKEIEKQLKKRQWGHAIRLEVETGVSEELVGILKNELDITDSDIYKIDGPIDLTFLMKLYGAVDYKAYKADPYMPLPTACLENDDDIFTNIRKKDILLHHPYESFDPVVNFIKQAAADPQVLAIKQTLYRVSGNSPIVAALVEAAENGKQVTVLVELKARFDEENNIIWAKKLEKAGCHVIYGLVGLKTHSKIALVVRKEEDGIRRYVHLGTGNYNDSTAKLYTDLGLFTCSPAIGEDATAVFNMLSGYSEPLGWNKLSIAPLWLRNRFYYLIDREAENARQKRPAHIVVKVNSLCDKEMIEHLYEASKAGVKIDLIVRGICCLIPGVEGLSENITVRSIVGTYLEHGRIFKFENNKNPEIYLASADWMSRNLDRRVEILFPVEDPELKKDAIHVLDVLMADNVKAQIMNPDGSYERVNAKGMAPVCAQEVFCEETRNKNLQVGVNTIQSRVFIPMEPNKI